MIWPQKPRKPGCPFLLRAVSSMVGGLLGSFSSLAVRGVGMLSQNLLSQAGFWEFAWWPDSGKVLLPSTTIFLFLKQVFLVSYVISRCTLPSYHGWWKCLWGMGPRAEVRDLRSPRKSQLWMLPFVFLHPSCLTHRVT